MCIRQAIAEGAARMACVLDPAQTARLAAYLELMSRWNRVYNLTAVREVREMVPRHILDSLAVAASLHGNQVLDVGTGAGLPGIPLAVACPQRAFVLLDSNTKRTRFLTQAKAELGLDNITIETAAVQDYQPRQRFSVIVSRAFAAPGKLVALVGHLLDEGGSVLAMQGRYDCGWREAIPTGYSLTRVDELSVPGQSSARHLLQIRRGTKHP